MSVEEKLTKIHKEIIPRMISPHAMQLLTATPVVSEIMEHMSAYLSLNDFDVERFKRNLQIPFNNKPEAAAFDDPQHSYATLAYIEKPALFNNPYNIEFRSVAKDMTSQVRTETEYLADFNSGDIIKTSEVAKLSPDGRYAKSKTVIETDYSREGVMTREESKTYSRPNSYMSEVKREDFIPNVGYGYLTEAVTRYRDENCPFIMHEVDQDGKELIQLVNLTNLNGLEPQTDDKTRLMYGNLLFERLGSDEYRRLGIEDIKDIATLSRMLGDMPANLRTSFASVEEAMEYVKKPEIGKAIDTMLDHQYYDRQTTNQLFLRDETDSKGYGNMFKKAFEKYVSRMQEKSKDVKPKEDPKRGKEGGPEFDY